jgi:small ubiquitin-related modifier
MSDPAQAANVLNIRVRSQQGEEVLFKIKQHTQMEKVIKAFSDKVGIEPASLRLTFDGERVTGDQTAADLELADGDVLDVMEFQIGGGL